MCVETFVCELPEVTIEGGLVRTCYRSGDTVTRTVSTIAFMRRYHEAGLRRLNDYELSERMRVVAFDKE